jgi:hypothetical protein
VKDTPNPQNLRVPLSIVGREPDHLAELVSDEHRRWTLYLEAFAVVPEEQERELLKAVLDDPDRPMRDSAVGTYVDNVATTLSSRGQMSDWLSSIQDLLALSPFASRRAEEWLLVKDAEEGNDARVISELPSGSDWLQRKLSEESTSEEILSVLSTEGRTKRIRSTAEKRKR